MPAAIREEVGLVEGTVLVAMATPSGVVLMTQEQLKSRVRAEMAGVDLVHDLLEERRAAAALEDA